MSCLALKTPLPVPKSNSDDARHLLLLSTEL
jgi:hypothetical protein